MKATYTPAMKGYRRLIVWQLADRIASSVHRLLRRKRVEAWLRSQAMRAAFSIPCNIVEGNARRSARDYLRFLDTAFSSLAELDYQLYFLANNELITIEEREELQPLLDEAGNRLIALMRSVSKAAVEGAWQQIGEERPEYVAGDSHLPSSPFHLRGEAG